MKIGSGWQSAIFLSLVFLCFTPLIFYPSNYSAYLSPKVLFLSLFLFLGVLFWAFDCLLGNGKQPSWNLSGLALLAFLAWSLFRYPWSSPTHAFLKGPFLWGSLGLTYFLARQYGGGRKAYLLVQLLALSGLLVSLYGLLQFLGIDLLLYRSAASVFGSIRPEGRWGRPFSTLGNPNFLGEFLAAVLPLALSLYLSSQKKPESLLWGTLSLTSGFALVATRARGPLLAGAAGLLLFLILERFQLHLRRLLLLLLAALILISGALFFEGTRSALIRSWEKVTMASSFSQGSVGARLLWWRVSAEMIRAHPLLGTGIGTFREAYPSFQRKFFQEPSSASWIPRVRAAWKDNYNAMVEAPHNEYLHVAAEMGLPGFFLFILFALLLLGGQLQSSSAGPPSWKNGCTASCFATLIASFFGFPLHLPSTGMIFFLLAGLITHREDVPKEAKETKKRTHLFFGTLLVLVACLVLLQWIHQAKVLQSGRHLYRSVGHQISGQPNRALEGLADAKRLNPQDPEIDYWLGLTHLSMGRLRSAEDFLGRAKSSFNSPRLYLTLGGIHADLKDPSTAEALYQEGIATYPGLAPLHARLGALYAQQGRYYQALQELRRAQKMDPFYAETHHFLGHLLYRMGRPREACQSLRDFLQLAAPSDPRRPLDQDLMQRIGARLKSP